MPDSEPRWLTADDITLINRETVAETDEPFGILDAGAVDRASAAPRNHFAYADDNDAVTLAVTLLNSLALAHAFAQGNKRTAFQAAVIFLELNGYTFAAPDKEVLALLVTRLVTHQLAPADFERIFRRFVVAL